LSAPGIHPLSEKNMSNKNLLTIHQGALGDVVTSFTSLLLLRETYSKIDLVCRQSVGQMAKYLKVIDQSFSLEASVFSCFFGNKDADINDSLTRFFEHYDDIVLFSFSRILAENIKKISGKRVFHIPSRPEPFKIMQVGHYLITRMIDSKLLKEKAENNFLDVYQDFRDPDFRKKKIFVHPGSGSLLKNWPLRYFIKLEKMLSADGFEPTFILGPVEDGLEEIILRNGVSNKKILQLFDLVKLVDNLKTGGAFIGNDSGVSHLAAFIGLPTLVIFGPTHPLRWRPMGKKVETISCRVGCEFCFETSKRNCLSMDCLTMISPEQVQTQFNKLIE
jgi:heptosyltransferase III